jgi:hypothetical protein
MSNPVQGSFVGRTKSIDTSNSFKRTYEVAASTTYEPTGSNLNSAFLIEAGANYTLTAVDGGDLTAGLVTGQVYQVALKKVVTGAGTVVKLLS